MASTPIATFAYLHWCGANPPSSRKLPALPRSRGPPKRGHFSAILAGVFIIEFEPAAPGHFPDQFRLRRLRPILTGEFARSLVLFQKGLFGLPVSLSIVSAVLFYGFTLQFVLAGLDHCVQHNLPLWAEGNMMCQCLLRRHLVGLCDTLASLHQLCTILMHGHCILHPLNEFCLLSFALSCVRARQVPLDNVVERRAGSPEKISAHMCF